MILSSADLEPPAASGFTAANTVGLTQVELVSLNCLLDRLLDVGLVEREAKLVIDVAARAWLEPRTAARADLADLVQYVPPERRIALGL